jgi:hypothetical protein
MGITEADAAEAARDTWDGIRPNMPSLGPGLDHHELDPGIYWRLQLGVRRGLYQRVLPYLQGFQCLGGCCHPQTCRGFCWDQIQNSFCENFTWELELSILPLIFSCRTLSGALSNQTKQTGSIKGGRCCQTPKVCCRLRSIRTPGHTPTRQLPRRRLLVKCRA